MTKPDITPEQAKNLEQLATYLEGLPEDYEWFDMLSYSEEAECGTVACACGHGPEAGIKIKFGEEWDDYAVRAFGVSYLSENWDFLFSASWASYQPTHKQAAERIRVFLKDGIPEAFRKGPSFAGPFFAYAQSLEKPND